MDRVMVKSACEGKVAFDSYKLAEQALNRKSRRANTERRCVYKCPVCRLWHIGTPHAAKGKRF